MPTVIIGACNDNGGKTRSTAIDARYRHIQMFRYGENNENFYVATVWLAENENGELVQAGKLHCALPHPECPKSQPPKFRPTPAEIKAKKRAHLSVVTDKLPS